MSRTMLAALGLLPFVCTAPPQVFVVNSSDDDREDVCDEAHCNLREAIQAADRTLRPAEIRFDLPGAAPYVIELRSALPALRHHLVVLDATTQEGAGCPMPIVQIDGAAIDSEEPVNGLEISGSRNQVRGLSITNFSGNGVVVDGSENQLQCLFVGVDPSGSAAGNGGHGIAVVGGHSNQVGGPDLEDGNLLSANGGHGLYTEDALDTRYANNAIGVDVLGSPRLPNGDAELPAINPPPPPSPLDARALALLTGILEQRIALVLEENASALEDAGLYEKYVALIEEDPTGAEPPADLFELIAALALQPELYKAFTQEAVAVLAEQRTRSATYLAGLRRLFGQAVPSFGRDAPKFAEDQQDLLGDLLSRFDPDDYTVSEEPSLIVTIDGPPPPFIQPLVWHSLQTYGAQNLNTSLSNIYYIRTCYGPQVTCYWPTAYDLMPFSVEFLWESSTLTQQEMDDIVQENGYFLSVHVNGQLLYGGPPFGSQGVDPLVQAQQGYMAATFPGDGDPCPVGKVCLAVAVLGRKILANIPQPWTFELDVAKVDPLPMPVIKGLDENGNPIIATHVTLPFAHGSRVIHPNPQTGGQSWFTAALLPTFKHGRCADCHGFGNFTNIAAHHGYQNYVQAFIDDYNVHLEPSLYVPGAHVMACYNCHLVPETDGHGHPFLETEWLAPFQDLDVNWNQKGSAQICTRVKSNLPTRELRDQHFHGDGRLYWAIEIGEVPGKILPTAPPQDFDVFLQRVDMWNFLGAPCP